MKKVNFAQGQKALVEDLNNLHNFTEEEVAELLRATTSSSTGKVLFDNKLPVAPVPVDNVLEISVEAQYFAVNGVIARVEDDVRQIAVSAAEPTQVAVFLIVGRQEVIEPRNFTSTDPGTQVIIQQDLDTVVRTIPTARVAYSTNSDLGVAVPDPVLGATDVGFVRLATVQYDNNDPGADPVVIGNTTDVYRLPDGVSVPVDDHAVEHLPGGTDPIQLAALVATGEEGGSRPGLLPAGAFTAISKAVLDVEAADTSEFINVTITGSNAAADVQDNGRTATIDLLRFDSLVVENGLLGVAFRQKNAQNGFEDTAARVDHIHPLADSGLIVQQFILPLTEASFGAVAAFSLTPPIVGGAPAVIGRILNVSVTWQPPNLIDNLATPGIQVGWQLYFKDGQNQTLGARAHIKATDEFDLEIGQLGACLVSGPAQTFAESLSNPSYGGGDFARTGRLVIIATATREGAVNLVS